MPLCAQACISNGGTASPVGTNKLSVLECTSGVYKVSSHLGTNPKDLNAPPFSLGVGSEVRIAPQTSPLPLVGQNLAGSL